MDRITRQKIKKEIENLSNSVNELDLIDIHTKNTPTTGKYIFF